MAQIQTIRGPIDSAQLGTTLMHEHVFVLDKEISENYPENWGLGEKRVADAVSRLNELKSRGVDTIVDLTVIGLGRYIPRIQRIAEQTRIQIIVAAGIYTYNDVIPALKQKGVSDEHVQTMLIENPRQIFERQGAY